MTSQVQKRRGTTTEHSTFTGAEGEITVDTTKDTAVVHDGVTTGGRALAREDLNNVAASTLTAKLNGAAITNVDINSGTIDGTTIGATTPSTGAFTALSASTSVTTANLTATGTTTLAGATTSADINFGDNDKAVFGAGSDLQIYHDGSHSRILHPSSSQGDLYIQANDVYLTNDSGNNILKGISGGALTAYYDNSAKLATTSTGIDVTGTATMDGLTVDAGAAATQAVFGGSRPLYVKSNTTPISYVTLGYGDREHIGISSSEIRLDGLGILDSNIQSMKIDASRDISFYEDTGTTAKFFWDASAESLGIGTSSPSSKLAITGSGDGGAILTANQTATNWNSGFKFQENGTDKAQITYLNSAWGGGVSDTLLISTNSTSPIRFNTNNAEAMRIDSSGNLLVGKTQYLNSATGVVIRSQATSGGDIRVTRGSDTGTQYPMSIYDTAGTGIGSISTTATATAYNTSSDYRLKEDWQPVANAITGVKALKPCNFAWKADGTRVNGFLAHELAEVVPEAVTGEKDAVDDEGNPVYQGIDQSKLVPLLTAALQEAIAKIETLEQRLTDAGL